MKEGSNRTQSIKEKNITKTVKKVKTLLNSPRFSLVEVCPSYKIGGILSSCLTWIKDIFVMSSNVDTSNGECQTDGHESHTNGSAVGKDEGDVLGFNFGRTRMKGPVAKSTVEKDADYYRMDHKHRGLALIFNHEHFDSPHLKSRAGTGADFENLYTTLVNLGFVVKPYHDPEFKVIQNAIDEAAEQDYTDADCFVMAVLTHGEDGILHAKDVPYKPKNLWSKFTADNCLTLAGKPKLFFIQACQGDKLDAGVTIRTQVDGHPSNTYSIPLHADFLMAYSTISGFFSWRNTQKGSWFMQALCAELKENAYSMDLLTILTRVFLAGDETGTSDKASLSAGDDLVPYLGPMPMFPPEWSL
ncbi:hypothetical protein M8J76_003720 [Diaphorina citri]|nr:hypothetical protein M8J76_003720 [Diaphorina citri]